MNSAKSDSLDPTSKPLPTKSTMINAFVKRKDKYEDAFYVGVKSTGIFNRVTCSARKPKKSNMVFFSSVKEALDYGYRPCKVCHPLKSIYANNEALFELFNTINQDPNYSVRDGELKVLGIDPFKLRRSFKYRFGITFQAYLKYNRINHRFGNIFFEHGSKNHQAYTLRPPVLAVNDEAKPGWDHEVQKQLVAITRIDTPIGPLIAGANADGICLLEFTDRRKLETQIKVLEKRLNATLYSGTNPFFKSLTRQIKSYFKGELKRFDLPLVMPGTDFQKKVWSAIMDVPYGRVRSYKQQAIEIDNPSAVRAVGHANGDNRIAIIVPCHRIVGNNGELMGYGGGLWRKKYLLELENPNQTKLFV